MDSEHLKVKAGDKQKLIICGFVKIQKVEIRNS